MTESRIATLESLVHRASVLLHQAEASGQSAPLAEAELIMSFLSSRFSEPLSREELLELTCRQDYDQRGSRILLDAMRLRQMMRSVAGEPLLVAAE